AAADWARAVPLGAISAAPASAPVFKNWRRSSERAFGRDSGSSAIDVPPGWRRTESAIYRASGSRSISVVDVRSRRVMPMLAASSAGAAAESPPADGLRDGDRRQRENR